MRNHTHTQYTSVLRGNPKREKTTECFFLYVFNNYIHWKHQLNFFPAATGRRLQPPSLSRYNLKEAPTPQFSGYNQKEAKTPYFSIYNLSEAPNPQFFGYN
jgi:hypothetical protein